MKKPKRKKSKKKLKAKAKSRPMPETSEVPEMYWEGEDGEGYKEDGCAWLFND